MINAVVLPVFLFLLLFYSNKYAKVMGGVLYLLSASPLYVPGAIGNVYRFLVNGPVKLSVAFKLIAWTMSGSGLSLGYIIYCHIWGTPHSHVEFWIIFFVAVSAFLEEAHRIILFDLVNFSETLEFGTPFYKKTGVGKIIEQHGASLAKRLVRTNFVDMNLTALIQLLVSVTFVVFSLERLDLVHSHVHPTLIECFSTTLSLLNLTGASPNLFYGATWQVIRALIVFIFFFWTIIFVALAASTINDQEVVQSFKDLQSGHVQDKMPKFKKYARQSWRMPRFKGRP